MGRCKEFMMKNIEHPFQNVPTHLVSEHLFKNRLLRNYILCNGSDGVCHYTDGFITVLPLKNIVIFINDILSKYFGAPDNEAVGWDSSFEDEGDKSIFHKELGGYIVPGNRKIYTDIAELLYENKFVVDDEALHRDIIDAFGEICLIQQDPYGLTEDEERFLDWRYIVENSIKMANKGMGFKDMVKIEASRLYHILEAIQTAHTSLLKEMPLRLFRCVNYDSTKVPPVNFSDLTSPPTQYTKDLRMSKQGDSIFYGAIEKETAKKEAVKVASDSYVYVGTFETTHNLHILDLTGITEDLSIFNQEQDSYYVLVFLSQFCHAISLPIHNSPTKYIPTQLITFYFRNCLKFYHIDGSKSNLDGILYSSSKDHCVNAVLFFDNANSATHLKLLEYEVIHENSSKTYTYPEGGGCVKTL
jgi:hypothetical protein